MPGSKPTLGAKENALMGEPASVGGTPRSRRNLLSVATVKKKTRRKRRGSRCVAQRIFRSGEGSVKITRDPRESVSQ